MVPGGLPVMARVARLTPGTPLMIRLLILFKSSYGDRARLRTARVPFSSGPSDTLDEDQAYVRILWRKLWITA